VLRIGLHGSKIKNKYIILILHRLITLSRTRGGGCNTIYNINDSLFCKCAVVDIHGPEITGYIIRLAIMYVIVELPIILYCV